MLRLSELLIQLDAHFCVVHVANTLLNVFQSVFVEVYCSSAPFSCMAYVVMITETFPLAT